MKLHCGNAIGHGESEMLALGREATNHGNHRARLLKECDAPERD